MILFKRWPVLWTRRDKEPSVKERGMMMVASDRMLRTTSFTKAYGHQYLEQRIDFESTEAELVRVSEFEVTEERDASLRAWELGAFADYYGHHSRPVYWWDLIPFVGKFFKYSYWQRTVVIDA